MATVTYSSFHGPCIADETHSSTALPQEQFSQLFIMDAVPIDLKKVVNMSGTAFEDEHCETGLTHLDFARYNLAPSTPTKERNRRATMPDSMKCRPHEVLSHSCHIHYLKKKHPPYYVLPFD